MLKTKQFIVLFSATAALLSAFFLVSNYGSQLSVNLLLQPSEGRPTPEQIMQKQLKQVVERAVAQFLLQSTHTVRPSRDEHRSGDSFEGGSENDEYSTEMNQISQELSGMISPIEADEDQLTASGHANFPKDDIKAVKKVWRLSSKGFAAHGGHATLGVSESSPRPVTEAGMEAIAERLLSAEDSWASKKMKPAAATSHLAAATPSASGAHYYSNSELKRDDIAQEDLKVMHAILPSRPHPAAATPAAASAPAAQHIAFAKKPIVPSISRRNAAYLAAEHSRTTQANRMLKAYEARQRAAAAKTARADDTDWWSWGLLPGHKRPAKLAGFHLSHPRRRRVAVAKSAAAAAAPTVAKPAAAQESGMTLEQHLCAVSPDCQPKPLPSAPSVATAADQQQQTRKAAAPIAKAAPKPAYPPLPDYGKEELEEDHLANMLLAADTRHRREEAAEKAAKAKAEQAREEAALRRRASERERDVEAAKDLSVLSRKRPALKKALPTKPAPVLSRYETEAKAELQRDNEAAKDLAALKKVLATKGKTLPKAAVVHHAKSSVPVISRRYPPRVKAEKKLNQEALADLERLQKKLAAVGEQLPRLPRRKAAPADPASSLVISRRYAPRVKAERHRDQEAARDLAALSKKLAHSGRRLPPRPFAAAARAAAAAARAAAPHLAAVVRDPEAQAQQDLKALSAAHPAAAAAAHSAAAAPARAA